MHLPASMTRYQMYHVSKRCLLPDYYSSAYDWTELHYITPMSVQ